MHTHFQGFIHITSCAVLSLYPSRVLSTGMRFLDNVQGPKPCKVSETQKTAQRQGTVHLPPLVLCMLRMLLLTQIPFTMHPLLSSACLILLDYFLVLTTYASTSIQPASMPGALQIDNATQNSAPNTSAKAQL